ncbi:MAG: tRNA (adenosine(37)-N6)-threonylcarbamoyltransferase complex dimerization subunit type 1 TsaB [Chitinophagales bacterium]
MAILLNIDTAVETASVCLSDNAEVIELLVNENHKDHAKWLHTAINDSVTRAGMVMADLNAVAITIGPGSYTGLRIGLATAKGLCFALQIPLICINTLQMMANAVKNEKSDLICPMIDARRMEVFTAIYNNSLEEIVKPFSTIVVKDSFADLLATRKIIFCGNGSKKLQNVLFHQNAIFSDIAGTAANLAILSSTCFHQKKFADLAYTEPIYLKEFYSPAH